MYRETADMLSSVFSLGDQLPVAEDELCAAQLDSLPRLATPVWLEQEIMSRYRPAGQATLHYTLLSRLTGHLLLVSPDTPRLPRPAEFRGLWFPDRLLGPARPHLDPAHNALFPTM